MKTWSCGKNSRLLFAVNLILNLSILSVLSELVLEEIFELLVRTNETIRYLRVSLLSECP